MITVSDGKIIKDKSNYLSSGTPSASVSVLIPSQGQGQPLLLHIENQVLYRQTASFPPELENLSHSLWNIFGYIVVDSYSSDTQTSDIFSKM